MFINTVIIPYYTRKHSYGFMKSNFKYFQHVFKQKFNQSRYFFLIIIFFLYRYYSNYHVFHDNRATSYGKNSDIFAFKRNLNIAIFYCDMNFMKKICIKIFLKLLDIIQGHRKRLDAFHIIIFNQILNIKQFFHCNVKNLIEVYLKKLQYGWLPLVTVGCSAHIKSIINL